jgi:hypothetical protein
MNKHFYEIRFLVIIFLIGFLPIISMPADSVIKKVTVFSKYAGIERNLTANLNAGKQLVRFSNLPNNLQDRSIQIAVKETEQVKILNVKVKKDYKDKIQENEINKISEKIKELDEDISSCSHQIDSINSRNTFLQTLMNNTAQSIANSEKALSFNAAQWTSMLNFLENEMNLSLVNKQKLSAKILQLKHQKNLNILKLNEYSQPQGLESKTIEVDVQTVKSGEFQFILKYLIPDSTWKPFYDIRINQKDQSANVTCAASVSQQTGEDWKDVQLTFSTAQPMTKKSIPVLKPMVLKNSVVLKPEELEEFEESMDEDNEISGIVSFDEGDVLPGVNVILFNQDFGKKVSVSNEHGFFSFRNLRPGQYQLQIELEGFKTLQIKDIHVTSGTVQRISAKMEMKNLNETIVITGKAPVLDRQSATQKVTHDLNSNWSGTSAGSSSKSNKETAEHSDNSESLVKIEAEHKRKSEHNNLSKYLRADQGIALTYPLSHPETILSNKSWQNATIFIKDFQTSLEHTSVPKRSDFTFLNASIMNTSENPLLPGETNIYYNGTFVNTCVLKFVNPGETFEVPMGIDESVVVKREEIKEDSDKKGLFKKKILKHQGYKITIKNFNQTPTKLKIIDQIPISENKQIELRDLQITPAPEKKEEEKESGIIEWKMVIQPGAEETIRVEYNLLYPPEFED